MSIKKRLLKSSSYLVLANFLVGLFGLITISIIAKSLSILEFGFFAIIQAYAMTINGLLNFQTWQTVVKHYPESRHENKLLKSLLKYSYKLDIVTAILATIIAMVLLPFINNFIQLDDGYIKVALLYLFTILFSIEGTITGYFRSIDKYNIFVIVGGVISFFKMLTIFFISIMNPSIENFIFAHVVFALFKSLLLNFLFIKNIGIKYFLDIFQVSTNIAKTKFKDIREFSIYTSITGSFDLVFKEGDVLVVSTFFGSQFAAIFKMIKTLGGLVLQIVNPIFLSLYPIISEKKNNIQELKKFINKTIFYLFFIALVGIGIFYIVHDDLIEIFFGSEYLQYSNYLMWYIIPIVISGVFTAVHPAFNLMGYHKINFYLIMITSMFYILMIYILKDTLVFYSVLYMLIVHAFIVIGFKYILIMKKETNV